MGAADDIAAQLGLNLSGVGAGLPSNQSLGMGQVYMGKRQAFSDVLPGARGNVKTNRQEDYYLSQNEADNLPAQWSTQETNDFIRSGVIRKIPGFNQNMGLPDVMNQWNNFTTLSASLAKQGIKMSPMDIMNTYQSQEGQTFKKGNWMYDAVTGQPVQYVGPTSRTDTSTKVDLSTREDALALAKTSMAQLLGRAPTDDEVGNYLNLLNGYEKENPTRSTTTTQISGETGEQIGSTTKTSGGVTQAARAALLEKNMEGTKEYGAYQAATTYMSALMQTLSRGY